MLDKLIKNLKRIEAALDKCRTSVLEDGWQTQRHAKKSRKWDYYAGEKRRILDAIADIEENQNS
jgi:hypothetical protein